MLEARQRKRSLEGLLTPSLEFPQAYLVNGPINAFSQWSWQVAPNSECKKSMNFILHHCLGLEDNEELVLTHLFNSCLENYCFPYSLERHCSQYKVSWPIVLVEQHRQSMKGIILLGTEFTCMAHSLDSWRRELLFLLYYMLHIGDIMWLIQHPIRMYMLPS